MIWTSYEGYIARYKSQKHGGYCILLEPLVRQTNTRYISTASNDVIHVTLMSSLAKQSTVLLVIETNM